MYKKLKSFLALSIVTTVVLTATIGCTKTDGDTKQNDVTKQSSTTASAATTTPAAVKKDPVTLNAFFFGADGGHYRAVDPVIEEFHKRTKDTLNTTLNITWTPPADHATKLRLNFAAGEDMDLVFPFERDQQANSGLFADLAEYFNKPKYPGLQRAFSPEYIKDNLYNGQMLLIPITNAFFDMEGVWYRKDLLKKYGMSDIASYDDLYNFLEKVLVENKELIPYGNYGNTAFFKLFMDPSARMLDGKVFSFTGINNPKQNFIDVQIADDGKSVKAIALYGDPSPEWAGFNETYGEQFVINMFNQCARFNKFIHKDTLTNPSSGKDAAAGFSTIGGFKGNVDREKLKYPESELGFFPLYSNYQTLKPGGQATDGKAWNFLAVPVTSKKIDRTMDFLNWVFESQENNDLFTYGIEGVNWEAVGDKEWKVPDGVDPNTNYMFPGYQLTWNPTLIRMPAGLDDKMKSYFEYQFIPETYTKHVLAGFTFNQEPVKNEMAQINSVMQSHMPLLLSGFGDVSKNLANLNKDLKASGAEKVKAELKKQINEFLAKK